MTIEQAIRLAAEQGCDMYWEPTRNRWVVNRIAVEAETLELSTRQLRLIDPETFVDDFLPRAL